MEVPLRQVATVDLVASRLLSPRCALTGQREMYCWDWRELEDQIEGEPLPARLVAEAVREVDVESDSSRWCAILEDGRVECSLMERP